MEDYRFNATNWMIYSERRSREIGNIIKPEWVAHLLGVSLNGKSGEEAISMLRELKVCPYYYCVPDQLDDWDRFPTELLPDNITKMEQKQKPAEEKEHVAHQPTSELDILRHIFHHQRVRVEIISPCFILQFDAFGIISNAHI
uniref:Athena n=1 Tax=Botryllus schlosseri TaxID=30301 RepID=Q4JGW7_BOTSH|nr:athena [Botryllus schlosseri]